MRLTAVIVLQVLLAGSYPFGCSGMFFRERPEAGAPSPLKGATGEPWELFPQNQVPGERPGTIGDELYWNIDPNVECNGVGSSDPVYGNVTRPQLVPFVVDSTAPHRTDIAMMVAPGGHYDILVWDKEGTDVARWLNTLGISAFVLKYRVPRRSWLDDPNILSSKAALMDAQRAISMIRAKAQHLNLSASRVGFLGFSAGANLAGDLTSSQDRMYPRFDVIDDVDYKPNFQLLLYGAATQSLVENKTVAAGFPPTFFAISGDDPCVNAYFVAVQFLLLRGAHGRAQPELHIYANGTHSYGRCSDRWVTKDYEVCNWPQDAIQFMSHTLGVQLLKSARNEHQ